METKDMAEAIENVATWLKNPNKRTHLYNDLEREARDWGDTARSAAVQALMDAGLVAEYLDKAIPQLIAMARSEGDTWEQIGETLGITRQAAQQKFAAWERVQVS